MTTRLHLTKGRIMQRPDFQELLASAQAHEEKMRSAHGSLALVTVSGRSTDGTVTILATGLGKVQAVRVDPKVFDQPDVNRLQDAIAEAIRAAGANAAEVATQRLGPVEINLY